MWIYLSSPLYISPILTFCFLESEDKASLFVSKAKPEKSFVLLILFPLRFFVEDFLLLYFLLG